MNEGLEIREPRRNMLLNAIRQIEPLAIIDILIILAFGLILLLLF